MKPARLPWAALLLVAASCSRPASVFRGAPVVLICVDTLRADRLPAYGYGKVATPALDLLVHDSIVFDNAISHVPLTLPSHVSLFTGLLPFQHGVRDNLGFRVSTAHPTLGTILKKSGYSSGGAVSAVVLDHGSGVSQGFDYWEDAIEARDVAQAIGQVQRPGDETARLLEKWIAGQPEGGKFLAFLHLYEPHSPYDPPEPFRARYRSEPYDGEVAAADAVVGRFLDFLREKNLYDRSLIVFLSDHGEGLGDHGEDEHGILLYREEIRVPLFVKLPGAKLSGSRVTQPVQIADVLPTVLGALGEQSPEGLPGRSLLDFVGGRGAAGATATARRIYSETLYPRYHFGWSDLASLTDDRYQYIHAPRAELYDWRADPSEKNDLAAGLPPAFRSMRAELVGMNRPLQSPGASDPETVKKLASLGYIGAAAPVSDEKDLPDPKDRLGTIDQLKDAARLVSEFRDGEAIALLSKLSRENPRMLDVWESLARVLRRSGRTRDALEALERADRLAPGTPQVMLGLAGLHREAGDFEGARKLALAAGEAGAPGFREELASIALATGDLSTARREAEAVLAANVEARAPRLLLARVALASGDVEGAFAQVDGAIRLDRQSGRTPAVGFRSMRGDLLARLGQEKEAEQDFRAEVASYPENLDGWARLALLSASQGRPGEPGGVLSEMTSRVPTARSYDTALRVCGILKDPVCARDWTRRKQERSAAAR
jgi:choline-sulfatase